MFNDNMKITIKYIPSNSIFIVIITKNNQSLERIDYLDFKIIETIITN